MAAYTRLPVRLTTAAVRSSLRRGTRTLTRSRRCRYIDLDRASCAFRKLGYFRLAWLCSDCKIALETQDAVPLHEDGDGEGDGEDK